MCLEQVVIQVHGVDLVDHVFLLLVFTNILYSSLFYTRKVFATY